MPAKAKIFNVKCEPVFDFGTGPRNLCYYNPQGNNILFYSFFIPFLIIGCFIWGSFSIRKAMISRQNARVPITENGSHERTVSCNCSSWFAL